MQEQGYISVCGAEGSGFERQLRFEAEVREFAREFDTPNVRRAIALCESGCLAWEQVAGLFRDSLARGLAEVSR